MTAIAFADEYRQPTTNRPTGTRGRTHLSLAPTLAPASTAFSGAVAPIIDDWLRPDAGRPQLDLIEGAGRVDVPARHVDPMIEVYRRRRFAVALALTAVILLVSQLLGVSLTSFGPTPQSDDSAPLVHVVRPGDTYPGIAATIGADDPVAFADELRAANGEAELVVGQRIVLDLGAFPTLG